MMRRDPLDRFASLGHGVLEAAPVSAAALGTATIAQARLVGQILAGQVEVTRAFYAGQIRHAVGLALAQGRAFEQAASRLGLAAARFEAFFYRALNQVVEPLVRAGFGSPVCLPAGLIVLEVRGRRTGRRLSLPLWATVLDRLVVVTTVRGRSQWLANLARDPTPRYWMNGRSQTARAVVFMAGRALPSPGTLPAIGAQLAAALLPLLQVWRGGFAILLPADSEALDRAAAARPT